MPARNEKLKEKANMGTRKKELAVKAPSLSLALSFLTSPSFLERPGKGKGKKRPRESAERKEEIGEKAAALTIFLPSLVFFSGLATRVSWPFFCLCMAAVSARETRALIAADLVMERERAFFSLSSRPN